MEKNLQRINISRSAKVIGESQYTLKYCNKAGSSRKKIQENTRKYKNEKKTWIIPCTGEK